MHEFSLMADLMNKIETVSREHDGRKVAAVKVKIGALAHISGDHFREHFVDAIRGTVADGAELDVVELTDTADPRAQEIILDSLELEEA